MTSREHPELVTHAQAAKILGCGVSNIPKLIRAGHLRSHGRRGPLAPSLDLDNVVQLAERRAHERVERQQRRNAPGPEPVNRRPEPVDGHRWLTPPEAAPIVGITAQAIRRRCLRGTMPHIKQGARWFIRADHARLAGHVRATDGPETVAVALQDID